MGKSQTADVEVQESNVSVESDDTNGNFPKKSDRYLSPWNSSIVKIDITQKKDGVSKIKTIDLGGIQLNLVGSAGIYQGMYQLSKFPHLMDALKRVINRLLISNDGGTPKSNVTKAVNHAVRFFICMLRQGIYKLADLTRDDIDAIAKQLIAKGWLGVLPYKQLLDDVEKLMASSDHMAAKFIGSGSRQGCTLRLENIRDHIGMPLESVELPTSLSEAAVRISGRPNIRKAKVDLDAKPERGTLKTALAIIDSLALHACGDSIPFRPFSSINKTLDQAFGPGGKRSRNLSLKDATKILKGACIGILDLAVPVTQLAESARTLLEASPTDAADAASATYETQLSQLLTEFRVAHEKLVAPIWPQNKPASYVLGSLVEYVQTSGAILTTFGYGLRANDAIGHEAHWGLYKGCVQPYKGFPGANRIELFVSKNLQDYAQFWCSKLTQKCVKALELLSQACRPAFSPLITQKESTEEQRKDKLFIRARFNKTGYFANRGQFAFGHGSGAFLKAVGVAPKSLDGERAFRRLFCIIYVYRYDDTSIAALSQRLFHFSLKQTEWYYTNGDGRKQAESIEYMFRQERLVMAELEEVRHEKFVGQIVDYLKGKPVGGGFPALLRNVIKGMASSIEFIKLPPEAKGVAVADKLAQKGYAPIERRNGECMIGSTTSHSREVNCTDCGVPHPENASLAMCNGCVMNQTTENYIQSYEEDLRELLAGAKNFKVPQVIRLAKVKQAADLKAVIAANHGLCAKNQASMSKLVAGWKAATQGDEAPENSPDKEHV